MVQLSSISAYTATYVCWLQGVYLIGVVKAGVHAKGSALLLERHPGKQVVTAIQLPDGR